jgi:hypothetical protein
MLDVIYDTKVPSCGRPVRRGGYLTRQRANAVHRSLPALNLCFEGRIGPTLRRTSPWASTASKI